MLLNISDDEFEQLVEQAIDSIPDSAIDMMQNVIFFIEDEYTPRPGEPENLEILGLYEGTALTERDSGWDAGALPDHITIFKNPTLRACETYQDVVREIRITLMHEVAHHFGIDDEKLHALGWS
ncbi:MULTISPECIES: metallopeptidase family protein [Micrococcaceae]|uniref:metallopeptidase family protein n=1 Tax=Micrococcaceae TaxID=1268 RepID=UPI0010367C14|nr:MULTISPECIES: metallopeptidase family protein [Micrococcaceae]TAP25258.1 metallopeptidase family protein [Arthrobacter sp. S41]UXN32239.1 metallopeptidase family protein [Glutamicibacter sp. M10]